MKAILLSGGAGTRLKSISGTLPKPMMPILGTPLLEHILRHLRGEGFTDVCMTLCYNPRPVREHFGDGAALGLRLTYREETAPLGTAGAVKNCRDFCGSAPVLIMSGDAACDFPLGELMTGHRGGVTVALSESEEPLAYGLVVTDSAGRITGFVEKPDWPRVVTDRVSTGIYVLDPAVLDHVPEGLPFDFAKDLFPELLRLGVPMHGALMEGYWRDIGTPRSYYQCNLDALDGLYRLPDAGDGRQILSCRSRARLMRSLGESLAEFGADFTDGITVENGHIAPLPDRSAILIEGGDTARLAALARKLEREI